MFYPYSHSGEPKTGRMHQIRVHLQWLGHPIVNDPIYNHPAWKQHPLSSNTQDQTNIEKIISEIVRTNYSSEDNGHSSSVPSVTPSSNLITCTPGILSDETTGTENCHESSDKYPIEDALPTVLTLNSSCSVSGELLSCCKDVEGSANITDTVASIEQTSVSPSSPEQPVADLCRDYDLDPDCSECSLNRSDPSPSDLLMYLHALSYKVGIPSVQKNSNTHCYTITDNQNRYYCQLLVCT